MDLKTALDLLGASIKGRAVNGPTKGPYSFVRGYCPNSNGLFSKDIHPARKFALFDRDKQRAMSACDVYLWYVLGPEYDDPFADPTFLPPDERK